MLRSLVISAALLLALVVRAGATEAVWVGSANGNWSDPANWSTGVVPTSTTDVHVDFNPAQNSAIQAGADISMGSLTIDAGDSLVIPNNTINASGKAQINGTLSFAGTPTQGILPNVTVGPTGEIQLTKSTSQLNYLGYVAPGGLVHGGGTVLNSSSTNDGEIRADLAAGPLSTPLGPIGGALTNNGRLTATGGGWLKIAAQLQSSGTLRGGRIEAYPNSRVTLGGSGGTTNINDAVLASIDDADPLTAAPIFELAGVVLSNPTIEGDIQIPAYSGGCGANRLVPPQCWLLMATTILSSIALISISGEHISAIRPRQMLARRPLSRNRLCWRS
ncbi:MAG TPA: hypothetical protein VHU84_05665 [Lacipirellulaceae bacterium]|nr:hypothetical protein [Lacipirellulaceae bacterium]